MKLGQVVKLKTAKFEKALIIELRQSSAVPAAMHRHARRSLHMPGEVCMSTTGAMVDAILVISADASNDK